MSEVTGGQSSRAGVNLMIRITDASRATRMYRSPRRLTHDRRIVTRYVDPSYIDTVQCVPIEVSAVFDLQAARRVPERLIEIEASSASRAPFEAASSTPETARSRSITTSSDPSSTDIFMFSQLHRSPASTGTMLPALTSRWNRAGAASHSHGSECWVSTDHPTCKRGSGAAGTAAPATSHGAEQGVVGRCRAQKRTRDPKEI